jgi:hypothetical protein
MSSNTLTSVKTRKQPNNNKKDHHKPKHEKKHENHNHKAIVSVPRSPKKHPAFVKGIGNLSTSWIRSFLEPLADRFLPVSSSVASSDLNARKTLINSDDDKKSFIVFRNMVFESMGLFPDKTGLYTLKDVPVSQSQVLQPLVAGILARVYGAEWQQVINYASWALLFEEYRIKRGKAELVPLYVASASTSSYVNYTGVSGAGIDPVDSTGPATWNDVLSLSDFRFFCQTSTNPKVHTWTMESKGQPDLMWSSTATNTTAYYLKMYGPNYGGGSSNALVSRWCLSIDFRAPGQL